MLKPFSIVAAIVLLLAACACWGKAVSNLAEVRSIGDTLSLTEARIFGKVSVEEAIYGRRSVRSFTDQDLTLFQVSQLFWAAQGVTETTGWSRRAAPSAGALYPLEVYILWRNMLWHYLPEIHSIELRKKGVTQDNLADASLGQSAIRQAPACFVICGVYSRTAAKYGNRAQRYVHIEVGHAAENLLLQAVALGLGGVTIGAFHDDKVSELIGLDEKESPLYVIPVGRKRTGEKRER